MRPSPSRTSVFALAWALAVLGGCGGGSDSAAPAPAQAAPLRDPADYLQAGFVSADSTTGKTLVVLDPAQPTSPRLSVRLGPSDLVSTVRALQVDKGEGTYTWIGATFSYVRREGRLYRLSLKKSDTTALAQMSTLTASCSLDAVRFLVLNPDPSGLIGMTDAGPDGLCGTADDRKLYVPANASATTAPMVLPDGVELLTPLLKPSLTEPMFFLATDARGGTTKLTLYNTDLTPAGDVVGGANVSGLSLPINARSIDSLWVRANNQLKHLTWSASGATLSADGLYTFTGSNRFVTVGDTNALYFVDGQKVIRVASGASPQTLATFSSTQGTPSLVGLFSGQLLFYGAGTISVSSNYRALYSLPIAGGPLQALSSLSDESNFRGVWGRTVFFATYHTTLVNGFYYPYYSVHRVNVDGTQPLTISPYASRLPQTISKRKTTFQVANDLEGLMWCEPTAASYPSCARGTLKMLTPATGVTTLLGSLSLPDTYAAWDLYDDFTVLQGTTVLLQAAGRTPDTTAIQEQALYLTRLGVTGSLTKVNVAP